MTYLLGGPKDGLDLSKSKNGEPPAFATDIHLPDARHKWLIHHYRLEKATQTAHDRYFIYVQTYEESNPETPSDNTE